MRTFSRSVTKCLVVVAAALLITAPFHSVAYGQTTTWTDGNGDWNTPGNWSAGLPNSTTSAVINNGSSVSLSAAGSTNNLTLASGNSLTISNNTSLTVFGSSISDSGTINLSSIGNVTDLIISNANTTLSGTGTLTLGNNSQNFIFGSVGADILTNSSTIQGSGNIGDGQMTMANSGTINANSGLGQNALFIQTSGGTTNTGTLEATNGSVLQITGASGGNVTNTGGTIKAVGSGSVVQLTGGVVITGGTLTTTTGGAIQGIGTATLSGLTISSGSSYQVNNNTTTFLNGTITNKGTITLASAGNGTNLELAGNTTLTGTGTVTLSNISQNFIFGSAANGSTVLTNQETIQGAGNIGDAQMSLVNSGTINANAGLGQNWLIIQTTGTGSTGTTNTGTIEATLGSNLVLQGGTFTNTGGTIEALNNTAGGSTVNINGADIIGGTLTTTGNGVIFGNTGTVLDGTSTHTVTNSGLFEIANNNSTSILGTINNTGTILLNSAGNVTDLIVGNNTGATSATINGTVTMSNNSQNFIFGALGTNTLTNNGTIQGSGNIGDTQMTLVNSATGIIDANSGSGQTALVIQTSGGTTNTGTLEATVGSNLILEGASGGNFTNTGGTIQAVGSGSTVELNDGVTITGGTLTTSGGGLIFSNNSATLSGLTISSGSAYQVNNNANTTLTGTITNNGTLTLASFGNVTPLEISGNVTLGGSGTVTMSNNSQNFIFGVAGSNVLTNNQTIQGSGNIGDTQMTLVNSATGIIDANSGSGQNALIIQTSGGTTNTGTLEATVGSNLILEGASGGNFTNTGGTIEAIGSGSTVQLNNGVTITGGTLTSSGGGLIFTPTSATLSGLTLSTGSNYQVNNNATTTLVGTITNNGTLTLASFGNVTILDISGNVSLNGLTGLLIMSNNSQNFIQGTTSTAVLTNNSTIEGAGNIGDAFMGLVNGKTGVIIANAGAGQNVLNIQPDTQNFNNQGTLSAVSGSVLDIITTNGAFTNFNSTTSTLTGGTYIANNATIEFPAGSNGILIDAAKITLTGASAEIFNTTNSTNALTNLNSTATSGSFTINGGANFTTAGNFTNHGTLNIGSGSAFVVNLADSLTNFNSSTHTLTGGTYIDSGTLQFAGANIRTIAANTSVTMSGTSAKMEDQTGAAVGLTNLATNNGTFAIASGFNFTTAGNFTNNGTLNVGSGTKFIVNLADSLTNFNSGTSTLTSGTYIVGGTLQFANASIVTNDASITLSGAASKIVNQSNVDALATTFATNDTGATFAIASGRNFTTPGNFTNNGTLTVASSNSKFDVNGSLTNFSGTTLNSGTYNVTGTLQFNGANIVTNAANITLTGASSQIIDQSSANGLANFATNNGTFTLAGSRSFTTIGNFANTGIFTINTGSTFSLGGSGMFTQSGGTTTDNGSLSASLGGVSLNGGSLFGTGSITGALTSSSAGTITPGDSSILTGILKDTGAYNQNSGILDISINGTTAGTKYDQLNPTTASLSGTLNISRPTGFVPAIGSTFKIMNFTSETGTFATVNGLAINTGEHFSLTYEPTDVLLTVVPGPAGPSRSPTTVTSSTNVTSLGKIVDSDLRATSGKRTGTAINISSTDQLLSLLDGAAPGPGGKITIPASKTTSNWRNSTRLNAAGRLNPDRRAVDILTASSLSGPRRLP